MPLWSGVDGVRPRLPEHFTNIASSLELGNDYPALPPSSWRGLEEQRCQNPPVGHTLASPSMPSVPGLGGMLMGTTCPAPLRASCLVVPNTLGLPKHRFLAPKANWCGCPGTWFCPCSSPPREHGARRGGSGAGAAAPLLQIKAAN